MSKKKRLSFLLDEEDTTSGNVQVDDDSFFNPVNKTNKIRYRCEQTNSTHSDKSIIFHANIKKEYLVEFLKKEKNIVFNSVLEDYVYSSEPKHFEIAMDAFRDLEYWKENISLQLNENGKIKQILNLNNLSDSWIKFKTKVLPDTDFFQELKKANKNAAKDIIDNGDIEFKNEKNLIKTLDKNVFYNILLDSYLIDLDHKTKITTLTFISQIFQKVKVKLEISETTIKEDNDFIYKRKVGTLIRDTLDNEELIRQYNLFYKPMIQYNFTEYNYIYRQSYRIDKKTGYITEGKAVFSEQIKNNYEFITEFTLKQVKI